MPIMASILLTTQRPIINHPHYEDVKLRYFDFQHTSLHYVQLTISSFCYKTNRERTKIVYRAFGRGTVAELYRSLVDLKVTYLVLQDHWCFGEPRYIFNDCFMVLLVARH